LSARANSKCVEILEKFSIPLVHAIDSDG
jgi:hypothetical protein